MNSRASIPLKVYESLWGDDQFYRNIEGHKKINIPKFPRCDQWYDDDGFYLAFALAGFSPDDIVVSSKLNTLKISNFNKIPSKKNNLQQGIIVRGIARRNFDIGFVIHDNYDVGKAVSVMKNGLLKISIPTREPVSEVNIKIRS